MGVRTGNDTERVTRRSGGDSDPTRMARRSMRARFKRFQDGDDDAWDSADDAQLYEYYLWMQRLVWKREPPAERKAALGYMRRVREQAGWSMADMFDYLQWWSERDESCRDRVAGWQQTTFFAALAKGNRERYEERR